MAPLELIEKFARYVDFDPDRENYSFSIEFGSGVIAYNRTYEMDKAIKRVPAINRCDPTGRLAVIYLKRQFEKDLQHQKVTLFDVIEDPGRFSADGSMWQLFNSPEVATIETELADLMSRINEEVAGRKLLGDSGNLTNLVADSTERVVSGLSECKRHIWLTDGRAIEKPAALPRVVMVFGSMAEALAVVSGSPDGLYLSFVRQENAVDGFFSMFVKSGNTIVSCDDFLCERYPGQHGKMRNNRYLEGKSFSFFPYEQVVEFRGMDYKGYVTGASVSEEAFPLSRLSEEDCAALVLAMSCYINEVDGMVADEEARLYVTSLSPRAALLDGPAKDLVLSQNHALVLANDTDGFTNLAEEQVISGVDSSGRDSPVVRRRTFFDDSTEVDLMAKALADVDLTGFKLERDGLIVPDGQEFIGTAATMRSVALRNAREQLADEFMRSLQAEFDAWGGMEHLASWYEGVLNENRDKIADACARKFQRRKKYFKEHPDEERKAEPAGFYFDGNLSVINLKGDPEEHPSLMFSCPDGEAPYRHAYQRTLDRLITLNAANPGKRARHGKRTPPHLVNQAGERCTVAYIFSPRTFDDVEALIGACDVPLIVRLWHSRRYTYGEMFGYAGNSILDLTDPVVELRNPLAGYTFDGCDSQQKCEANAYSFRFQIGFTKRELNALFKSQQEG